MDEQIHSFTTAHNLLDQLTSDLGNFSLIILFFGVARHYNLLNNNLFFLAAFMMLSPFLFNNSLFPWSLLPDQTKYLDLTMLFRDNLPLSLDYIFKTTFGLWEVSNKVRASSILYTHFPLLSIETFKSIGFINRALFVATILFFITRGYLSVYLKVLVLLAPSVLIYSSVALRDNLVLLLMIWSCYFYLTNRYILLFISFLILFQLKLQNLYLLIFTFYTITLMNNDFSKKNKYLIGLPILVSMLIVFFYHDQIIFAADGLRKGMYAEHVGFYLSDTANFTYTKLELNLNTIITFFKSYIQFITSPIGKIDNWFLLIIALETIFIYLFIFINFYKDIRIKKLNRLVKTWIIILSGYIGLYCMFIFNAGQLTRYRYVLLFVVMIGYEIHKKIILNKKVR